MVRFTPDIALRADGIRSTSDAFRDEIQAILDEVLPRFVRPERPLTIPASQFRDSFESWPLAERLAAVIGAPSSLRAWRATDGRTPAVQLHQATSLPRPARLDLADGTRPDD